MQFSENFRWGSDIFGVSEQEGTLQDVLRCNAIEHLVYETKVVIFLLSETDGCLLDIFGNSRFCSS